MGELFKTQHTIDELLNRMGATIVLDGEHLSEEDRQEAEKNGAVVKGKNNIPEGTEKPDR